MGSDAKAGGGGGKSLDYYGTIAGAVCMGVAEHVGAVLIDGKEAWPNAPAWKSGISITAAGQLRRWGGRTWFAKTGPSYPYTSSGADAPPNSTYWGTFYMSRGSDIVTDLQINGWGLMRFFWGTASQTAPAQMQAAGNEFGEDHPDYKHVFFVMLSRFLFGRERQSAPNVEIITVVPPVQTVITGTPASINMNDQQANLITTAAALLTSNNALGLPDADLDATSFQATADELQAQHGRTGASPLLDTADPLRAIFAQFAEVANAWMRFNPETRKIEAGQWVLGSVPASYHTLTVNDLAAIPEMDSQGWEAAKTQAFVTYTNRARGYKRTSERAPDPRAFRVLQHHRTVQLQRPHITRQTQALKYGAEYLRVLGGPQMDGSILVRREKGRAIRPGDYALVPINLEPGSTAVNQFFRVLDREIPFKGPIKLFLDADETLAAESADGEDTSDVELDLAVDEVVNLRVVEAPVSLSEFEPDHVMVLAERPGEKQVGYQLYFDTDSGGTFQIIGDARGWATRATLRSDLTDSAATVEITLPDQVDDDRITAPASDLNAADDFLVAVLVEKDGSAIKADGDEYQWVEIVSISAIALDSGSDYDLTVLRARQHTSARAFTAANCEVWIIPRTSIAAFTHKKFDDLRTNRIEGTTPSIGYFRVAPYTADDSRALADCSNVAFEFAKSSPAGPVLTLTAPASTAPHQYPIDWVLGQVWTAGSDPENRCWHGGVGYRCILGHTADAAKEPGVGGTWATYWVSEAPAYPYEFDLEGTWTDPNKDMTAFKIGVRKAGGDEVIDEDDNFPPTDLMPFSETIHIAEDATWYVTLTGFDASGLSTKRVVTVEARGSNTQVAKPKFRAHHGKKLKGEEWNFYGKIALKCATAGATIEYRFKIGEDRDWALDDVYVIGDKRWNGGVIWTCWLGHTADAAKEPGVGGSYATYWKDSSASVAWADVTVYAVGDKRTNNGISYFCYSGHTSVAANNEPGAGSGWKNRWIYADEVLAGAAFDGLGAWHTYDDSTEGFSTQPYGWLPTDKIREILEARATLGGYTTSEINTLTIRSRRVSNSDNAP